MRDGVRIIHIILIVPHYGACFQIHDVNALRESSDPQPMIIQQ